MTLNCLIVDDEPLALDLLESYVSRTPFLHLVAQCDSAVKALSVILIFKIFYKSISIYSI